MKSIQKILPYVASTGLVAAMVIPSLAFAQAAPPDAVCLGTYNLCTLVLQIKNIINLILVPLLFAVAFIVFLYGVAVTYIFSNGDAEKVAEGHRLVLWGVIGFAVMVSLWGLVNIVANTFGLGGQDAYDLFPTV
jgi:uncharacterized membrane protein